ncbi:HET-domain-containing protein [Apiospora arundinis]
MPRERDGLTTRASSDLRTEKPCGICEYPNWTEVQGGPTLPNELMLQEGSYDEIRASVGTGCCGCRLLWEGWNYAIPESDCRDKEWLTWNRASSTDSALYLHVFRHPRGVANIDIFTLPGQPRYQHVREAPMIPRTTNLDENLCRIRKWLAHCESQHLSCAAVGAETAAPSRLLDVGVDASDDTVRLVNGGSGSSSSDVGRAATRYICLSHCWGRTRSQHITLRSNLESQYRGIPLRELPRTFRDAVAVTRALGDDDADWHSHVDVMARIYGAAYLTLAAGASADDEGGFFRDAAPQHVDVHRFTLLDASSGSGGWTIQMRHCLPHPDEKWPIGPVLPLMRRGWVFQERILSRRFLCFAQNEVFWECREGVACPCSQADGGEVRPNEGEGHGLGARGMVTRSSFPNCPPTKYDMAHMSTLSSEQLMELWRDLVSTFSLRELTFADDKLPALDGMRQAFQGEMARRGVHPMPTYLWGLWTGPSLTRDLQWYNFFKTEQGRPREAPSWSWVAAADGGIEWRSGLQSTGWTIKEIVDVGSARGTGQQASPPEMPETALLLHARLSDPVSFLTCPRDGIDWPGAMELVFPGYWQCMVYRRADSTENGAVSAPPIDFGDAAPQEANLEELALNYEDFISLRDDSLGGNSSEFIADYVFWPDETDLRRSLDGARFLEMGAMSMDLGSDDPMLFVEGPVLRERGQRLGGRPAYERIGWLRHRPTRKPDGDGHVPTGSFQDILII